MQFKAKVVFFIVGNYNFEKYNLLIALDISKRNGHCASA